MPKSNRKTASGNKKNFSGLNIFQDGKNVKGTTVADTLTLCQQMRVYSPSPEES